MNSSQRKYALERLHEMENAAARAAALRHTTKGTVLSQEEKLQLIRRGGVGLKREAWLSQRLENAFDFSTVEAPDKVDSKKLEMDLRKIASAFTKARDELMLGDADLALKLINKLEAEWLKG